MNRQSVREQLDWLNFDPLLYELMERHPSDWDIVGSQLVLVIEDGRAQSMSNYVGKAKSQSDLWKSRVRRMKGNPGGLEAGEIRESREVLVLVGSNTHIGMGSAELENMAANRDGIRLTLNEGGAREGALFIHSTRRLAMGSVEGCTVKNLASIGDSIWKISIAEQKKTVSQLIHLRMIR